MKVVLVVQFVVGLWIASSSAYAGVVHFEGFEDPNWSNSQSGTWRPFFFGSVNRVESGTNGIDSRSGQAHAVLDASLRGDGPYTQFGGYRTQFGNGYTTSLAIYLEPDWISGRTFTYQVGVNRQNGDQLRFFNWRFQAQGSALTVNTAHTGDTGGTADSPVLTITDRGWYTFENVFRNADGSLLVDFNTYDINDTLLYSTSRGEAADEIATRVGGNRYGWLRNETGSAVSGLAIDNTRLTAMAVSEPGTTLLFAFGLLGLAVAVRRRRAGPIAQAA